MAAAPGLARRPPSLYGRADVVDTRAVDRLFDRAVGSADRRRGPQCTDHRGRMEACLVDARFRDQRHAAHQLGAGNRAAQHVRPAGAVPFACRQHRGQDNRACMDRGALERVVVILAMRRGTVDQRRAA